MFGMSSDVKINKRTKKFDENNPHSYKRAR